MKELQGSTKAQRAWPRRVFLKKVGLWTGGLIFSREILWAESYLTLDQAKDVLWGPDIRWQSLKVELTRDQKKSIQKASKVRVRNSALNTWRTPEGGWLIVDQVIGKHENIDLAVALTVNGKVKGLEILTYRETYGHEIHNAKWRQQFHGRGPEEHLKLNRQIKNITGATLSCRHVTDGINRLTQTWNLVLRHL